MAATVDHHDDEGPSDAKLVIEACRSNSTDLLSTILERIGSSEKAAITLNEAQTVMGNYAYHEAALRGNWDIIDMLLDQEGFECDPVNPRDGDTPLHSAVRWVNGLPKEQWENASGLIEMMLEAGSEPKIRNKANLKAAELVEPANKALRKMIEDQEYLNANQSDFVDYNDAVDGEGDEEDPTGSNSDSDFDIENKPADNDAEGKRLRV